MMDIISCILVLWDIMKRLSNVLPKAIDTYKLKRFFGSHIFDKERVFLVVDTYKDPRLRTGNRYEKDFLGRKGRQGLVGGNIIYGTFSPKEVAMFGSLLAPFRKNPIEVVTDEEVNTVMDATLICFGSSDSNLKTYDIENQYGKQFYEFFFNINGQRAFRMRQTIYNLDQGTPAKDKAVLLKIKNPNDKGYSYIICAGLSEWGTLAACYYLVRNWKTLYREYKRKDFCLLLEVNYVRS